MEDGPYGQARILDAEIRKGTHELQESAEEPKPPGSKEKEKDPAAKGISRRQVKVPSTPPTMPVAAPTTPGEPATAAAPNTPTAVEAIPAEGASSSAAGGSKDAPMEPMPEQQQMDLQHFLLRPVSLSNGFFVNFAW